MKRKILFNFRLESQLDNGRPLRKVKKNVLNTASYFNFHSTQETKNNFASKFFGKAKSKATTRKKNNSDLALLFRYLIHTYTHMQHSQCVSFTPSESYFQVLHTRI